MQGGQQWQQRQQEDHSNQQEQFKQKQPQYPEQSQPHVDEQSEPLHLKIPQPQQQQKQKELEQKQHQHQQKQCLQQPLQTHQQPQQLHLQPQVQQQQYQQFNHQQPLQAATGGQKTSSPIPLSHVVQMILPELSREQAERVSATLLRFQRKEITKDDFEKSVRIVVGDKLLVQEINDILKRQQAQSQSAPSSQPNQLQQKHQQHTQGSIQQFFTEQRSHTQKLNVQKPVQHVPPSGIKAPAQDSRSRQPMHPQGGVQAKRGPTQLSNIKTMTKYDLSKSSKSQKDKERQKMLQSGGTSYLSGQHEPSVWATASDKEQSGNTGILPPLSVHQKHRINDNSDQQHNLQTLLPISDNFSTINGVFFNHKQSLVEIKTADVGCQRFKMSNISSANISTSNHPPGSTGIHSDHVMQLYVGKAMLATSSTATLHHTLSAFGGPISGGHSSGNLLQGQMCNQVLSTPSSSAFGSQIKTPPKIPLFGQKKYYEASFPSKQLPSKKQKVSEDYLSQCINQLNDATFVCGVNLREEEELLFAGPKDESCVTEAMKKVAQEEESFFLQTGPLHEKLAGIMAKYGIKYFSTDIEIYLSLCVEERLRTMIGQLIRLSKQRIDLERVSLKVTLTSNVRRQILAMNKTTMEDLEKKQTEEMENIQKLYETSTTENNASTEAEKEESHAKAQREHKDEADKLKANAAIVAARAAIGGVDMLSKWQLMAEQAQQKRKGTSHQASNTCTNRDVNRKSMVGRLHAANVSAHQNAPSAGMVRNLGRALGPLSQTETVRAICVQDVIAFLEREPQMTKSTLLYRLYERHAECNKEKPSENQNNENTS